jgi:integrase
MAEKPTRLVRRENGYWYVLFPGNSRGISTGTRNGVEAEQYLKGFLHRRGQQAGVQTGLTVHQAIDDYLVEHVRPNIVSREAAEIAASYFKSHFAPDSRVTDVRDEDMESYIRRRRASQIVLKRENPKPAGDGTLRREIGFLSSAFEHASRKKDADGRPRLPKAEIPHLPRPKQPAARNRWLQPEEEEQLVAACPVNEADEIRRRSENIRERLRDPHFIGPPRPPLDIPANARLTRIYRFLILGLETAARKEALETMLWTQIDFRTGVIDLNPRGRRQTNKRRAIVRMSTRLRAVLERAWAERNSGFVLDHQGDIRTSFERLVERSGLEDVTPHILRHTWATRAAQNGVSMREIADWLGDNIATVEKNYYHHSPHYLKDAVDWRDREAGRR